MIEENEFVQKVVEHIKILENLEQNLNTRNINDKHFNMDNEIPEYENINIFCEVVDLIY